MFAVPKKIRAQKNEVVVQDDTIYVTLFGLQTKDIAADMLEQFKDAVSLQRIKTGKAFVFVDVRGLQDDDVTTHARVAMKEAFRQPFDALSAVGHNKLVEVAMYLIKSGGANKRARYFTSESKAWSWLQQSRNPKPPRNNAIIICADIVGLIGVLGLLGWWLDNQYLMSVLPDLRPINPVAALGLTALCGGLASLWLRWPRNQLVMGCFVLVLGIASLLPVGVDSLLFADKIAMAGEHTQIADSAAVCFILAGLSLLIMQSKAMWAHVLRYAFALTILGISLFNIFGAMYAKDYIYGLSPTFVMALNLASAFLFAGGLLVGLAFQQHRGQIVTRLNKTGWLIIAALLFAQVVTFASWQQSIARNNADARRAFDLRTEELSKGIEGRVRSYVDALYGFKGLFASSESITEGEFNTYYNTIDLTNKYPGLRALSFISRVETKDLPAFVAARKKDDSALAGGHPNFAITQQGDKSPHYILTFLANNPSSTGVGRDFTNDPLRLATYQKAVSTGLPAATDTITFPGDDTMPEERGFFITMPLVSKSSALQSNSKRHIGLVSVVFNYDDFFNSMFSSSSGLLDDVDVEITEPGRTGNIYTSDHSKLHNTFAYVNTVSVADRNWQVHVNAPSTFGIGAGQTQMPLVIAWSGQLFSLLLVIVFMIQNQARRRALKLADAITADLQEERNRAVSIQQKDEAILSSIGDAVFAIDTMGVITLFNPAAQKLSGFTTQEAVGKPYTDILRFEYEDTGKPNTQFITKALGGQLASMENHTVIVRKNGSRTAVADSAAPIRDLAGTLVGVIVVFRDVSEEYKLDKAKSEFVSLASHQLRTPLSAINWYAEMMLNGDVGALNEEQLNYLREIYQGNQRMVELVNSLLDVSRLDLGKLSNEPVPNNIGEVIESLHKELIAAIESKQMTLTITVEPQLPPWVADAKLVRMIVQNLFSNAVKYTPNKGSVTVTARAATAQDTAAAGLKTNEPHLYLSVQDTGFGIPKSQQEKIFSKLFRADNVRAMDVEGTGLGLYIVKEVVEKLGGKVWFESTESVGSTFYVVVPFTTPPQEQ